jgi:hypothetical protein
MIGWAFDVLWPDGRGGAEHPVRHRSRISRLGPGRGVARRPSDPGAAARPRRRRPARSRRRPARMTPPGRGRGAGRRGGPQSWHPCESGLGPSPPILDAHRAVRRGRVLAGGQGGDNVGITGASKSASRLAPARSRAASPAKTHKHPGRNDMYAFLGVKGSRVQVPPSRRFFEHI